jgi:Thymidylate synthase
MIVISARNVNDAWLEAKQLFSNKELYTIKPSRVGEVAEINEPVVTRYDKPNERVLFDPVRDANPFFHLLEGLWMLAGRRDVAWIKRFNSKFDQYSDDKITFHGAYGFRWRNHWTFDQINHIIKMLKTTPTERRAVLQMWDPAIDGQGSGLDYPCNTNIYFKIRNGELYMTVCCRSNDIIYGTYGANAVHMSMLHEYMAGMIGVGLGPYHQISDSFHYYTAVGEKLGIHDTSGHNYDMYNPTCRRS